MADDTSTLFKLTASIVSAYVRHNSVPSAELPALIGQVHTALTRVSSGRGEALGDARRFLETPMVLLPSPCAQTTLTGQKPPPHL